MNAAHEYSVTGRTESRKVRVEMEQPMEVYFLSAGFLSLYRYVCSLSSSNSFFTSQMCFCTSCCTKLGKFLRFANRWIKCTIIQKGLCLR